MAEQGEPGRTGVPREALAALHERFGGHVSTADGVRDQHARGEGMHQRHPPDAVLFAESTQDVAAALAICDAFALPVVPFGVGTLLEGQVQAIAGGLKIDLSRMADILDVSPGDDQAGQVREVMGSYGVALEWAHSQEERNRLYSRHAGDQARARSARHHEPRQDRACVTASQGATAFEPIYYALRESHGPAEG